jgi:hypothetical protein
LHQPFLIHHWNYHDVLYVIVTPADPGLNRPRSLPVQHETPAYKLSVTT